MQIILRKMDSGTNLLLFLYKFNSNFSENTEGDIKLSALLQLMTLLNKNETVTRMTLSRAVSSGLFINTKKGNEVYYTPTSLGKELIDASVDKTIYAFQRFGLRNSSWDNRWLCANILPSDALDKEKKTKLMEGLKLLGFSSIRENIWLSPYPMADELMKLSERLDCKENIVTVHGDLNTNGNLSTFLEETFRLKDYAARYKDFTRVYQTKLDAYKKISNHGTILDTKISLLLFYELGYTFFNISFQDAFLPKEILSEWDGEKAAQITQELFALLIPSLKYYFKLYGGV